MAGDFGVDVRGGGTDLGVDVRGGVTDLGVDVRVRDSDNYFFY